MRPLSSLSRSTALVLSLGVIAAPLLAQDSPARVAYGNGTAAAQGPISMTLERRSVQTVADGTHITRVTHETYIRDGKGRLRTETEFGPMPGNEVQTRRVMVNDTVAGTIYNWQAGAPEARKVYTVWRVPARTGAPASATPMLRVAPDNTSAGHPAANGTLASGTPGAATPEVTSSPAVQAATLSQGTGNALQARSSGLRTQVTRDPLGQRIVGGLVCMAQRITTVTPVGLIGNDRPITAMDETCMSAEAGRVIEETREDPRTGVETVRLLSADRADPDASLFLPPGDYIELKQTPPLPPQR